MRQRGELFSRIMNSIVTHTMSQLDFRLKPIATGSVNEHLSVVRDRNANLYLYQRNDTLIAFDAGYGGSVLRRELEKLSVDPNAVAALFLTHSDVDHARGVGLFRNARIYLSEDEKQMIDGTTPRFFSIYYNYNRNIHDPVFLRDGNTVDIGDTQVKAIETPGHTPGSMSYLIDGSILITGDTLFLRRGRACEFLRSYTMDTEMDRRSIRKLSQLEGISLICTAHSGYTDNFQLATEEWHR
jgi:hydroxyacylglutathione hydrolase